MGASEDELDDPDADAYDPDETDESDDAVDNSNTIINDVDDANILGMDDAQTKLSCD